MLDRNKHSRRQVLKLGMVGGGVFLGGGLLSACTGRFEMLKQLNAGTTSPSTSKAFQPDLEINLRATTGQAPILPGVKTSVWRYEATVMKGDPTSVVAFPDNYLGPIVYARHGQKIRVNMTNDLPNGQSHIVHWHGLHLPETMDGHPGNSVANGQRYVYEFEVKNPAGTYWFHPHTHEQTAQQVNMGLAGLFIVNDDEEAALNLPSGEFDLPIIIQDRTFDVDNQFVYLADAGMGGVGGMNMQRMMGFLGEHILINGKPDFVLNVATRAYRMRILNGSNSRIYKLAWSDDTPLTVIATDGRLLAKPTERNFVMLAPGERVDMWVDFGGRKLGDELQLQSQVFEGAESMAMNGTGMQGMGSMMSQGNAPPLGALLTLMTVRVDRQSVSNTTLPTQLSKLNLLRIEDAINPSAPRQFRLQMRQRNWLINGRSFEMHEAMTDEQVKLGTTEVWEFINELNPGEMMEQMGMAHPFHIHGLQFHIIERDVLPELATGWDGVRNGLIDDGWKDTFLIMPGERVKVLVHFADFTGKYVFHCHNLEHENSGMMRNYEVLM